MYRLGSVLCDWSHDGGTCRHSVLGYSVQGLEDSLSVTGSVVLVKDGDVMFHVVAHLCYCFCITGGYAIQFPSCK